MAGEKRPVTSFFLDLIDGKHYKKVPRGYDADHPNAEYLLYNGLTARAEEKVPDAFLFRGTYWLCIYTLQKYVAPAQMA